MLDQTTKRRVFAVRVNTETPEILDNLARQYGCFRINGEGILVGATGVLLDKIAAGGITISASH